mmetsp:Transcript_31267/g.52531  ORF Transcript_31267/g.52531 Transcript_31267/m.52531 type:complete len:227 (+) Transcript_31267:1348-2028(+)
MAGPRRPHGGLLRVQPIRGREAARRVRRGAEEARHGQVQPRALHALLRAMGGEREVAAEGEDRPEGDGGEQAESAVQLPVHPAFAAQVCHRRPGPDRGVPSDPQVDVRLWVLLLRQLRHPGGPQLFRVHAGQRGECAGDAITRSRARSVQIHEPERNAPAGQPGSEWLTCGSPGGHSRVPSHGLPRQRQLCVRILRIQRLPLQAHRPYRHHQEPLPDSGASAGEGA